MEKNLLIILFITKTPIYSKYNKNNIIVLSIYYIIGHMYHSQEVVTLNKLRIMIVLYSEIV